MHSRAERFKVDFRVVWDDGESYFTGPVMNFSETGLFIETAMPVPAGRKVTIIPLVDGVALFELQGTVVREVPEDLDNAPDRTTGMGVNFIDIKPEQVAELRRMIAQHKI